MDRSIAPVVVLALLVVAAAAPLASGHGRSRTMQGTFGDYNVIYYTAEGLTGGEPLNAAWQAQHVETGANYTENTTATFTFRDADNATLSETTVNATRFGDTEFLVSPVRIVEQARWMDAALELPNATATFGQPVGATGQDGDDGDPPEESTPLPGALAVTALAAAWWLRRR